MKLINKTILAALIAASPLTGCDTDALHDLNVNPQALNTIPMPILFTTAELGSASGGSSGDNRYIDWRTNIGFAGYAIQQLSTATGGISPGDKYFDNVESYAAPWEFIYGDQLKNLAEIIKQTGPGGYDEGNNNIRQAARILRVFNFHRLTDYYGNIPYNEALKGIEKVFFPTYNTQQEIYTDLLKELDEATAAMQPLVSTNRDDVAFAEADLIYDGDIAKWKKFGYSLMLRLAMRVSNVALPMANTYVAKAVAGGVFTTNDDNVWIPMNDGPNEWTNQNGISRAFSAGDGGQPTTLSKSLIDALKGPNAGSTVDDDPRLFIFSEGFNGNTDPLAQRGLPNGLDQTMIDAMEGKTGVVVAETFSQMNDKLLDDADPYMLMNYAEVEFLLAEAGERGIGGVSAATAAAHYAAGVKAAMQMYTPFDATLAVSDAAVTAYLAARPYPVAGTLTAKLDAIGTQLWLSKFMNWWDAWSDWRRTGFPALTPTNYPGNVTGGTIPVKLRLPSHEVAGNPNYLTGATMPDLPTTKVWWDGGN
ncbi:SusD/RagB family nutrient-binding outer membrane lipoprotein [Fulvivirgaceae bacterium PWU4]|uniref:SusD/RagB family nutrient-binding outer membrane lipoprotein n=1 Tax=Chryseosolibacter histidini TaxID=2782349 RepID=A0AAP2DHH0_9BACT|nr:SusD/RagB family nutrient-binding outer membrane lipoprotein [Chryseosolibacter histidini]MBT1695282.1 SusD/RagB family nutrient-binding outer membrane lipoprotein [Chryseosolibacter histidini]